MTIKKEFIMSEQNPYSTPEASLNSSQQEKYQPKFLSFKGRIGRLRYLAYSFGASILLLVAMAILMTIVAVLGMSTDMAQEGMPLGVMLVVGLYYVLAIILGVMFGKRRLNDLDKSGWWILLFFIPVLNIAFAIYILFFAGSEDTNNFGHAPVENSTTIKAFAIAFPLFFVVVGILAAIAIPAYQDYVQRTQAMQMQQGQ
jgi:uncharacterized membrane protein YhaH (DUF805 family)